MTLREILSFYRAAMRAWFERRSLRYRVRYLGDVQRLQLQSGDVVVITVPGHITDDMAQHLMKQWAERFGADPKCLVLSDGMRIGLLNTNPKETQS